MKCPHCKKTISRIVKGPIAKRAQELHAAGLSTRDICYFLIREGHDVSPSTISRYFRKG